MMQQQTLQQQQVQVHQVQQQQQQQQQQTHLHAHPLHHASAAAHVNTQAILAAAAAGQTQYSPYHSNHNANQAIYNTIPTLSNGAIVSERKSLIHLFYTLIFIDRLSTCTNDIAKWTNNTRTNCNKWFSCSRFTNAARSYLCRSISSIVSYNDSIINTKWPITTTPEN